MSFRTGKPISITTLALAAALFTGCKESPNGPAPVTSAEARADLESMASQVRYFVPQDPGGGDLDLGEFAKRAAPKTAAASGAGSACEVESIDIQDYSESGVGGAMTHYIDTTLSYTSKNQPVCAEDDLVAYELTSGHSENDMLETHAKLRTDFPANIFAGDIRITGNGTVRYKDGYLITVTSMDIVLNFMEEKLKKYVMNLALEKGYTVALQEAPGANMLAEEITADKVAISGPIIKDGTVVGFFEVMGDDSVIIRDANKAIIESHG